MGARDDVDADELTDALGAAGACFGGGFDGGDVAPDDGGDVAAANLLVAYEFDLGGLDHSVGGLDHPDKPASLNHSKSVGHCCSP